MTERVDVVAQELPEGTVTVLFTDVEGSTDLTNRLGDGPRATSYGPCTSWCGSRWGSIAATR